MCSSAAQEQLGMSTRKSPLQHLSMIASFFAIEAALLVALVTVQVSTLRARPTGLELELAICRTASHRLSLM